jgi:hypothetical protein
MPKTIATVVLFKPSGKYYTTEEWKVPAGAVWPYTMEFSPDFHRIDGGAVLIPEQEPWGVPHLFPAVKTFTPESATGDVARRAYENGARDERALTAILGESLADGGVPTWQEKEPEPTGVKHAGADGACPPGCASGVCAHAGDGEHDCADPTAEATCYYEPEPETVTYGDPLWELRTWVDVRNGDTVRMPGTDATAQIVSALAEGWHVDPKTGTSSWNPPQPLEFTVIHVRMTPIGDVQERVFDANPAAPVEILMDQVTLDAIELLGGWPNRIRTEHANDTRGN